MLDEESARRCPRRGHLMRYPGVKKIIISRLLFTVSKLHQVNGIVCQALELLVTKTL